jgi:hypothetical protein
MSLTALDQQDTLEASVTTPTADERPDKIAQLQARRQHDANLRQHLEASGASPRSFTAPDRRSMKPTHGPAVCDKVQGAGEPQYQLIVAQEGTTEVTDQEPLAPMATRAQAIRDTEHRDPLAARGYYNGDEGKPCFAEGIVSYSPKPNTSAHTT